MAFASDSERKKAFNKTYQVIKEREQMGEPVEPRA